MKYLFMVRDSTIPLITVLNKGVVPKVNKRQTTYFIFDTDPTGISYTITEEEYQEKGGVNGRVLGTIPVNFLY